LTLAAMLGGISITLVVPFLGEIIGNSQGIISSNNIAKTIETIFSFAGLNLSVVNIMVVFLAILLLQTLVSQFNSFYTAKLHVQFSKNLSEKLVNGYLNASLSYYHNVKIGRLVNSLTLECDRASNTLTLLSYMIRELVLGFVYILIPFAISWEISIIVITLGLVLTMLIKNLHIRAEQFGESLTRGNIDVQSEISEKLSAIKDIKSGVSEERVHQRFMDSISNKLYYRYKSLVNSAYVVNIQTLAEGVILVGVIVSTILYFKLDFQSLVVLLISLQRFTPNIRMANRWYNEIRVTLPSLQLIQLSLNELREAEEIDVADSDEIEYINDDILFKNISYKYKSSDRNFKLDNINLLIANNKITAILGKSGSGKSTIVDILLGFNVPDKGSIYIGNKSVEDIKIKSLRKQMGYIAQDAVLFNDTIKNNITWYKPTATDVDINTAAKLANIDDFILQLPNGYETVVGDKGVKLSGGQKQRIILTRNLILNPSILILDEATSNLDAESEALILSAIKSLSNQMTIILITHRIKTADIADKIYWIHNGHISYK